MQILHKDERINILEDQVEMLEMTVQKLNGELEKLEDHLSHATGKIFQFYKREPV